MSRRRPHHSLGAPGSAQLLVPSYSDAREEEADRSSVRSTSTQASTTASLASRLAVLNIDYASERDKNTQQGVDLQSVYELEGSESAYDEDEETEHADDDDPHDPPDDAAAGEAGAGGAMATAAGAGVHHSPLPRLPPFQVCSRLFTYKPGQPVVLKRLSIQQCEELRLNGYTIIDGLVSKELAAHVRQTVVALHRKGRLEDPAKAAAQTGVPPDSCFPERVTRGDWVMWLTTGRPPADSYPLSAVLVVLQEVYEDLAQFVRLRRHVCEYQVSMQPSGALGMSRHRDAWPDSGGPAHSGHSASYAAVAAAAAPHHTGPPHHYPPSRLAATSSTGNEAALAPASVPPSAGAAGGCGTGHAATNRTGSAPQPADHRLHCAPDSNSGAATMAPTAQQQQQQQQQQQEPAAAQQPTQQHQVSAQAPASAPGSTHSTGDSRAMSALAATGTGAATAGAAAAPQQGSAQQVPAHASAASNGTPADDPGPAARTSTVAAPAHAQHALHGSGGTAATVPPLAAALGLAPQLLPRRLTCVVCCTSDWERDQGGVVRIWPPRRGATHASGAAAHREPRGAAAGPGVGRRSLTGSEAGLSQVSNDDARSDTFSLRSHYLANFGAASVTSSMWAELGAHEAETASVDGSSLADVGGDKEERMGMEWSEVEGETVLDVAPLGGRMLLFLSGAVEHAISPAATDVAAVTAWF